MTRETKIGLLVGLAFIIVIGILLSDHMTSTTEPQKAPLANAGENVRQGVATPASQGNVPAVMGAAAGATATVTPAQPVMTREELAAAQQRQQQQQQRQQVQTIQVGPGPGAAQQQPPIEITQGPAQVQPQAPPPNVVTPNAPAPDAPVAINTTPRQTGPGHPLQGVAARHGEELVTVGPDGTPQPRPQQTGVPMTPLREYKAQTGDSLSRIAARFMGSASKANRDAIVRANPSLHQQPDRIIEGRVYLIPLPPQAEAQPQPQAQVQPAAQQNAQPAAPASSVSQGFTWYTVKENDNLWKIASEQCGTGNAWAEIKDLNKDILRNGETVRPNMRIRIPAKPVASAS
ncbi:MAG TPA: LysM peptidoglycan-binding domain-containing protein [Tepidisphaeraceae bacterium]|nr:LysM peptidoglycan-binding domain-containing protein [Tepidisphaeraceae bacterium]